MASQLLMAIPSTLPAASLASSAFASNALRCGEVFCTGRIVVQEPVSLRYTLLPVKSSKEFRPCQSETWSA